MFLETFPRKSNERVDQDSTESRYFNPIPSRSIGRIPTFGDCGGKISQALLQSEGQKKVCQNEKNLSSLKLKYKINTKVEMGKLL